MTRPIAVNVLNAASKAVGSVRGQQHGDLNPSFDMIAEMWSTYINHAEHRRTGVMPIPRIEITGADVLRMMGQMKQARAVWGDPNNPDHYIDEAGYSALTAAYLGVPVPEAPPLQEHTPPAPPEDRGEPPAVDEVALGDSIGVNTSTEQELVNAIRAASGEAEIPEFLKKRDK